MKRLNVLFIFGAIAVVLLVVGATQPVRAIRGQFQTVLSPFSQSSYLATTKTNSLMALFGDIRGLAVENSGLKAENTTLKAKVAELNETNYKLSLLQKELNAQGTSSNRKFVPAAVIGRSPSSYRDVLTIDKGSSDGLSANQPVISNGFLIGKVIQVFSSTSQIELITSHRFVAPVVLQNSRLLGLLKGGLKGLTVEQLPVDGKITEGETIVTSGLAGELPEGIPIGTVKNVISKPSDIFHTISVETPVNSNQIEIVLVILGNK